MTVEVSMPVVVSKVISKKDKQILRELVEKVAEIAALPVQQEKAGMWKRLNGLERVKPMIWINEIPWHEMDVNGELELKTEDEFCRMLETGLRQTIYQWEHMRGDMVVEPKIYCPLVIYDTGFGISEDVDIVRTDEKSSIISRHFHPQIQEEKDIEKIKMPEVVYDAEATEHNYQQMVDIFDGILTVEKRGVPGFWFAPWDELIRWWGVQEAMMDLVLRPELVHKAMDRLVEAYLRRLDQYEELNLLSLNNNNTRIGSGGYGYTDELPQPGHDPAHIKAADLWGCAAAQIFSEVSPEMHEEFALKYEIRWLKRFGLNYYGCCEPLHKKIGILKQIPNLRKISMSPWVNVEEGAANIGNKYVFSYKPSPAIFAADAWDLEAARAQLVSALEKTRGCVVEVIMKDISTVRYQPQRLWEWTEMAAQVTEDFA
ncbi:MAG: hypothetical protein HPY71_09400 [Firmicutes bacterium]|nr:hypothetical protein [Bacillota bacterium]